MKRCNILVTGTSSYGVGEGLIKVISQSQFRNMIKLVGASNSNLSAFRNLVDKYHVLPSAIAQNYIESLEKVIQDEEIDILIPGSEAEMDLLSKRHEDFGIDVWVNSSETINIFNNKLNAHNFFEKHHFETPTVISDNEDLTFPLIIKPVNGKSSEGIFVVKNINQLRAVEELNKTFNTDYIIQEYINGGDEYTVSLINTGDRKDILIMKRFLNKGATQYAVVEENEEIFKITSRLDEVLQDYLILNLQIINNNDGFYILEVNPRFSGSSPIRALLGFNEFDIIFSQKFLGQRLPYSINRTHFAVRGYSEVLYPVVEWK